MRTPRSALSRGLRLLLFVLRATALVLMLLILMRPQRLQSAPDPDQKSLFTVALDFHASMNTRDVGGASRWETARQALVHRGKAAFSGSWPKSINWPAAPLPNRSRCSTPGRNCPSPMRRV